MTKKPKRPKVKKALKRYRVWFEQVNQTCVDVHAVDKTDAMNKAECVWHKDNAWPAIGDVKEVT